MKWNQWIGVYGSLSVTVIGLNWVLSSGFAADVPDLPRALTSFGATVCEGRLYVYGGHLGETHEYSAAMASDVLYGLELGSRSEWSRIEGGTPAQSPALVAHGAWLYRIGGMVGRNAAGEKADLYSLASVERISVQGGTVGKWEDSWPLPEPRSSHDAALVGGQIFVAGGWRLAGGRGSGEWHDTALVLDLAKDSKWKVIPQPFRRRGLCLVAVGRKIFCLGGMSEEGETLRDVSVYDLETGEWGAAPSLPPSRMNGFGLAACTVGETIFASGFSGSLLRLEWGGTEWVECGRLEKPRFFHRLAPGTSGELLAIGGQGKEEKLSSVEVFVSHLRDF